MDDRPWIREDILLRIAKLYEGWTYTVEQATYNEQ